MTEEEFKKLWVREAGNQPGLVLEVLPLSGINLDEKAA